MSITDRFEPNLFAGKVLPTKTVRDHLMRLLADEIAMAAANEYRAPGAFDAAVTLGAGSGNDKLSIGAGRIVDGIGNSIIVPASDSRLTNVPFSNSAGEDYYFGLQVAFYPAAVGSEPLIEQDVYLQNRYRYFKKTIGRTSHPQSVTLNGDGTLKFNLDNMVARDAADAGYKGRTAKVWLVNPATSDAAVAVQSLTVENVGSGNTVSTSNGAAEAFGQSTPSTSVYDYLVCIEGPEVSRNAVFASGDLTGTFSVVEDTDGNWSLTGTGSAFTTEIVPGDWIITNTGIPLLVLYVASNTSARLLNGPPGGLAAGQTGATQAGIFIVGFCMGTGPAAPASGFSTELQSVIDFRVSDLAEVLRRDSHGKTKVRVKADASDADEPQVEVNNAAGNRTFYVNEKGTAKPAVYGTDSYELLSEVSRNGSTQKVRTYLSAGVDIFTTVNAKWDQAAGAWDPDVNGDPAAGYLLSDNEFQIVTKDVTTGNFTWQTIIGFDDASGGAPFVTMSAYKGAAKGLIFDFPQFLAGDGASNYNLISVLGAGANGSIRLYHKTNATPKGLCLTVNAEWDGANWDKDVNAAPALRMLFGTDGAEDGTLSFQIENGESDNFADGAWGSWLSINEALAHADFGGLTVRSDQFSASLSTLPFKALSRVTNAADAVAHSAESQNQLTSGVARYQEWKQNSGSGDAVMAAIDRHGRFVTRNNHFHDDFIYRTLVGPRWKRVATHADGDDFESGMSTGGTFVDGGWAQVRSGTVNGNEECLLIDETIFNQSSNPVIRCVLGLGGDNGDATPLECTVEVGLFETSTVGSDGIYLRAENSVTNWKLVTKDAGAEGTPADTSIAVADADGVSMEIELVVTGGVATVFINGSKTAAATKSTNFPTNNLKLGARIKKTTASVGSRYLYVDSFSVSQNRVV